MIPWRLVYGKTLAIMWKYNNLSKVGISKARMFVFQMNLLECFNLTITI